MPIVVANQFGVKLRMILPCIGTSATCVMGLVVATTCCMASLLIIEEKIRDHVNQFQRIVQDVSIDIFD